jgi:hypothetical protein
MIGPGLAPDDSPPRVAALVDSGAERTFAAPWLARAVGVDLQNAPEILVGLGGASRRVRFADVTLRLIAPDGTSTVEWRSQTCAVHRTCTSATVEGMARGSGFEKPSGSYAYRADIGQDPATGQRRSDSPGCGRCGREPHSWSRL